MKILTFVFGCFSKKLTALVSLIALVLIIAGYDFHSPAGNTVNPPDYFDITKQFSSSKENSSKYSINDILSGQLDSHLINPIEKYGLGSKKITYWYTGNLPIELHDADYDFLEVPYSLLYKFDIWFVAENGSVLSHYQSGPFYPKSKHLRDDNKLVFPIPAKEQHSSSVIIAIETADSVVFSAILWQKNAWENNQNFWQIWQLFIFGATAVLVLFNLFLSAVLREPSHAYYALYLSGLTTVNAIIAGTINHDAISDVTGNQMLQYTIATTILLDAFFINRFLNIKKLYPQTWRISILVLVLLFIPLFLAFTGVLNHAFVDKYLVMFVTFFATNIGLLYYFVISIISYKKGVKEARFVILAFSSFFISYGIFRLYTFNIIDYQPFLIHMIEVGTLLEGLLFSLALADKINLLSIEKEKIELQTLALSRGFTRNFILEQERDREAFSKKLQSSIIQDFEFLKEQLDSIIAECNANNIGCEPEQELDRSIDSCHNLLQSVRSMSHDLHPHLLKRLGLKQALEFTLETALNSHKIEWQSAICKVSDKLDEEKKLILFRVVQDCLTNLLTHADITEVIFSLEEHKNNIKVNIKDDGIQILNTSELEFNYEMDNIKRRIDLYEGVFLSTSDPEKGCHLLITIPL